MKWTYRPALDGLRMLAMYIIILFHTGVGWVQGGFVSVDLFFVLSGYLVTNVILSEVDRTGRLDLGKFYSRRVRRLLPAALVVIVATTLIFVLITSVVRRLAIIGDAQAALLYVANWRFISQSNDYFATDESVSPFLHFWTLAIEEQFYFVFPIVLVLLMRSKRSWAVPVGLSAMFLGSLASQVYWGRVDEIHAYYGTDARLYQLVAGALLAVAMRAAWFRVGPGAARALAIGGLTLFLLLVSSWLPLSQSNRGIVATVACVMLITGLMVDEKQVVGRFFSAKIPVYLGTITYATYLWHWPIIVVLQEFIATSPETLAVLAGVLATAMAAASAELLEMPIRTTKLLDPHRWKVVVVGLASSVLIAVTFIPWSLAQERQPSLAADVQNGQTNGVGGVAATTAADEAEEIPAEIDWQAIRDDKGTDLPCNAADPRDCIVVEGDGPHVLLVGDSHARMLAPMFRQIAEDQGFTFSMNVLAGCMWQPDLINNNSPPGRIDNCESIRVGWYEDKLPQLDPDVVILVSQDRLASRAKSRPIEPRRSTDEPLKRTLLRSSRRTLDLISETADRVILVEDVLTPDTFAPDECLATAETAVDCVVTLPVETPPTTASYIALDADRDDVDTVNLNAVFCPSAPTCQPIVDGSVVWRDRYHVATDFAVERRDEVWKLLQGTGAFG
ncbi:MAG: acyltransferase family protein [Nocardioides sp.]|nr:acyltransferase family protein [Nocardioides sp.]